MAGVPSCGADATAVAGKPGRAVKAVNKVSR